MSDVRLFEVFDPGFMEFEWDEEKRIVNIGKHGVDFRRVVEIFDQSFARKFSERRGENRYLAIGVLDGQEIAVAYTERNDVCRIVSARPAHRSERRAYRTLYPSGD